MVEELYQQNGTEVPIHFLLFIPQACETGGYTLLEAVTDERVNLKYFPLIIKLGIFLSSENKKSLFQH